MKPLINASQLTKTFSDKTLFQDLTFSIGDRERVGLLGPNGAGKSTLLGLLTKNVDSDSGVVSLKKGLFYHEVKQVLFSKKKGSVRELIYEELSQGNAHIAKPDENEMEIMAADIGLPPLDGPTENLSGGELKKIQLAAAFLSGAELVFLDEPTNHLDLKSIFWLEEKLRRAPFAWICISHDRYFLDKVASRFLELSPIYEKGSFEAKGNYEEFLKQKSLYLSEKENRKESLQNKLRKEEKWLKTQPKARTTKSRSRIDRAHEMGSELKSLKAMESNEVGDIAFLHTERKSQKLLSLKKISYAVGERQLFSEESLEVTKRNRIAFLGLNGSGKSTLLKIMAGEIQPDSGRVERAFNLRLSYFDQSRKLLETDESVQSFLGDGGDHVLYNGRSIHISSWLKNFGINFEKKDSAVSSLSGGEKAKIYIAKLLLEPCDVLILDEPTNDLDIDTLQVLEKGLLSFPGTIILVSHDRFFLNRICTKFLVLTEGKPMDSFFSLADWLKSLKDGKEKKGKKEAPKSSVQKKKVKLSYMEQREFDEMDKKVEKLEMKIEEHKEKMASPEVLSDHKKLQEMGDALEKDETELAKLYERWQVLEEKQSS